MRTDKRPAELGKRYLVEIRPATKGERYIDMGIIWVADRDQRPFRREAVIIEEMTS